MIYRFKVWFEEDDEIIRWIDMKPTNTFKDFHAEILKSINFKDKEPASFFLTNDRWVKGFEITLEDMGFDETDDPKSLMNNSLLKDYINDPHQKFIYINDFLQMWTLHIELQSILEKSKGVTYPHLYKSVGNAPKQNVQENRASLLDDLDFDNIANELISGKGGRMSDFIETEGFEDDDISDEDDEFGSGYDDGYDDSDTKDLY